MEQTRESLQSMARVVHEAALRTEDKMGVSKAQLLEVDELLITLANAETLTVVKVERSADHYEVVLNSEEHPGLGVDDEVWLMKSTPDEQP